MTKEDLKNLLCKPMPDIEIAQKIICEKKVESYRHSRELKSLDKRLKSKYVTNILYMMWELLTKVNKEDCKNILSPLDGNGYFVEHTNGRYLIIDTLEFSECGYYVKIQDSWSNIWVFPTETFKYKKNFKKRKSIYYKFLKQRALIEFPKKIQKLKDSIEMYKSYVKSYDNQIKSLEKELQKIKSNPHLRPLDVDDLGFVLTEEKEE